ncbi:DUF560 domain-containing protein [Proteus mirabilis]|nr:DUF560 domain-containing protein [Proteus mirabilis]
MRYYQRLIKSLFIINILFHSSQGAATQPNQEQLNKEKVAQLGQQLYHHLQQQQWYQAEKLLVNYQQLPLHETLLVYYAQALLAQKNGNFLQAEFYYQQQLKQQADFIPAQTGLIQLYFSQGEYKKAQYQLNQLSRLSGLSPAINQAIIYYQKQLNDYFKARRFYQISFFYDDNINHAPYLDEQIVSQSTQVIMTRKGAQPIASMGVSHLFSFYQPTFIYANNTLSGYFLARYRDYFAYKQANFTHLYTQLSYQYQKKDYRWTLSPYYEIKSPKKAFEYQSIGVYTGLFFSINKYHSINLSINYYIKKYNKELINLNNHKQIYAISYYYTLAENVQLVNQLNYYSSRKKNTLLNYQQYDIKTGVYYLLPKNWQVSLSLQYQFKSFNNYNPLLNKKREDNGFVFTTTIKNKAPIIWGFYPAIELSYTRRLSNVDWLYQYQQHEVLFKLEKQF